jgi:phosphoribosyl-dephospho-CoA transferase
MSYHRHSLIYLNESARPLTSEHGARERLFSDWLQKRHPFICTRQPPNLDKQTIQVGLPYLKNKKKIRFSYVIKMEDISKIEEPPLLSEVFSHRPSDFDVRVYGSYCWEYVTQLPYVQDFSDLDILIYYKNFSVDVIYTWIRRLKEELKIPRIDGEIRFQGLGDCAFGEIIQNKLASILFKNLNDVFILDRSCLYAKYPALFLQ